MRKMAPAAQNIISRTNICVTPNLSLRQVTLRLQTTRSVQLHSVMSVT